MVGRTLSVLLLCVGIFCLNQEYHPARAWPVHGSGLFIPPTPVQASSAGFNTLLANKTLTSLSTFDVNQTHAHTFDWYTDNNQYAAWAGCTGIVPTPSWWSIVAGAVNISTNTSSCGGYQNQTILYTGSGTYYSQVPLIHGASGFYAEVTTKQNYVANGCGPWMNDITISLDQFQGSGTGFNKAEIDLFEIDATKVTQSVHQWDAYNHVLNTITSGATLTADYHTNFGKRGVLEIPKARNAGTGQLTFWNDNVQTGSTYSYTTDTLGLSIENSDFTLLNCAGFNGATTLQSYYVWGPP